MSENKEPEKPKEEQIFPAKPEQTPEQQQIDLLTNQNSSLVSILQGIVITLDKISRSQSTNIGTLSTQLENVLEALKKSSQQPPQQMQ